MDAIPALPCRSPAPFRPRPGPEQPRAGPQDDTYTESYISTIGVDFVSSRHRDFLQVDRLQAGPLTPGAPRRKSGLWS